jgi:hypothetical protein
VSGQSCISQRLIFLGTIFGEQAVKCTTEKAAAKDDFLDDWSECDSIKQLSCRRRANRQTGATQNKEGGNRACGSRKNRIKPIHRATRRNPSEIGEYLPFPQTGIKEDNCDRRNGYAQPWTEGAEEGLEEEA